MNELRTLRERPFSPPAPQGEQSTWHAPRGSFENEVASMRSPELDESVRDILRGMHDQENPLSINDAIAWLRWEWKHQTQSMSAKEKMQRMDQLIESTRLILQSEDQNLSELRHQIDERRPDRHRENLIVQGKILMEMSQQAQQYQAAVSSIAKHARGWLLEEYISTGNDRIDAPRLKAIQDPFGIEQIAHKARNSHYQMINREYEVAKRLRIMRNKNQERGVVIHQKLWEEPIRRKDGKEDVYKEREYAQKDVYNASREIRAHKLEAERNFKTAYTHKESARKLTTTSAYHLIKLLKATGVEESSARELLLEIEKHGAKAIKTQSGVRGFFARAREGWSEGGFGKMFKNAFRPDVPSSDELTKAADAYRLHARELNHWQGEANKWQKAYQELL